jgi:hypothetical protein
MKTLKRIQARLDETAAVRVAKILKTLAPLLTKSGFKVSTDNTTTGSKVPTAFEGNRAVKDTVALLQTLGLQKDAKQSKGQVNFTTADRELVQVRVENGKTVVVTEPAYKPL